jgi:muramoyltetrapeptide carboxypeptidase
LPAAARQKTHKPTRLKAGHEVRLVAPAGALFQKVRLEIAFENMIGLGLKPTAGTHALDRHGYFAGTDEDRAADIMAAFADPNVKAIFALSGGWGAARLLPLLDFDIIRANPKVIIGYSDITALLCGIHARTGMTTFHGPNGTSRWRPAVVDMARQILFEGNSPTIKNPVPDYDTLAQHSLRVQTINPGTAEGTLVGGNLTVLTALAGSPYMADMKGKILFLEDVGEAIYRVDRMLSTLQLSGALDAVSGIVFGGFTDVGNDGDGYGAFALMDIFEHYGKLANVPTFYGAPFGHIASNGIMPIGTRAQIDATTGTIRLLEPSVL